MNLTFTARGLCVRVKATYLACSLLVMMASSICQCADAVHTHMPIHHNIDPPHDSQAH